MSKARSLRSAARFLTSVDKARRRLRMLRANLLIPPPVDIVTWIEGNISLPKESSSEGGTELRLYGYQKGIAKACVDPRITWLVIPKATRTGLTQLMTSVAAYFVAYEGTLVGFWVPIEDKAREYASTYWTPLFKKSKGTRDLIRKPRKGDTQDTWNERTYANGAKMYISSAQSDDNFRSRTIRVTMGDEVDGEGWMPTSPKSQGNKFKLMWERSRSFWNRKQILWSSPLNKRTSNIWPQWLASDQRRYFVACPHCEQRQYLQWGGAKTQHGIKWKCDDAGVVVDAWYQCEVNGCIIQEEEKYRMDQWAYEAPDELNLGWRPTNPQPGRPGLAGFHVAGVMSLFDGANWKQLAQEWLDAQGKPADLQTFVNNVLGEPWEDMQARTVTVGGLGERAEPYNAEVPPWVICITLAGDNQTGSVDQSKENAKLARTEISVWGWGRHEECCLIGHFVLDRHPLMSPAAKEELKALIKRRWTKRDGTQIRSAATFLDAGDGNVINEVAEFCNDPELAPYNVWAIRGKPERGFKPDPVLGDREGYTAKGKKFLWIGTRSVKNTLDRMLRVSEPGPGYVHFPLSMRTDPNLAGYFDDMLAEGLKRDKQGRETWERKGVNTGEAWDCFVYAYAALQWCKRRYPTKLGAAILGRGGEPPAPRVRYEGADMSAMSDLSQDMSMVARDGHEPEQRRAIMPSAPKGPPPKPKPPRAPLSVRSSFGGRR